MNRISGHSGLSRIISMALTFLLVFSLCVGFVPPGGFSVLADSPGTLTRFTTGEFEQNGQSLTVKKTNGNNYVLSDQSAVAFTLCADFTITETGEDVANILFDVDTPAAPGTNWMAVSVLPKTNQVRIFKENDRKNFNVYTALPSSVDLTPEGGGTVRFNLKVQVTLEKMVYVYINDIRIGSYFYAGYDGGYIGFMTFKTGVEVKNIRYTPGQPASMDEGFDTNIAGWYGQSGSWAVEETGLHGNNAASGDRFALSRRFMGWDETFVYEGEMTVSEGMGGGLVFGVTDPSAPSSHWISANVDRNQNRAKLFKNQNGEVWAVSRELSAEEKATDTYRFRIEVIRGGSFNYYLNDTLVGSYTDSSYTGGYLGVYTFKGDNRYNHLMLQTGEAPEIEGVTVKDAVVNPGPAFTEFQYDVNVPADRETASICVDTAEDNLVWIDGKEALPNQAVDVGLHIGSQTIVLTVQDPETGISVHQSMHIYREINPTSIYREKYRAQLHFSPAVNWLNDPNGLVYNEETKEYHLFFQHNPYGYDWGNMSWGHAVSKDLMHWEQKEVAMYTDASGAIFSGCGVIDRYNTTGFFDESTPPGARMVLIYSYNGGDTSQGTQRQALAYSKDNGETWIKYEGNPVLPNPGNMYGNGFRDPKVLWLEDDSYENGGIWLLIAAGGRARLFTSEDLIHWEHNSDLFCKDENGNDIPLESECPDLFPLQLEGTSTIKWVYTGSGKFFVVGDLEKNAEGKYVFVPETAQIPMVNSASRLYATQSYFNDPQGRRLLVSWVRDLTTAAALESEGKVWNGMYTIPMVAKLYKEGDAYRLTTELPEEVKAYRGEKIKEIRSQTVSPDSDNLLEGIQAEKLDIEASIQLGSATEVGFNLRVGEKNWLNVRYDVAAQQLILDKTKTGTIYAEMETMDLPVGTDGVLNLRILLDTSAIDVYADNGRAGTTTVYFTDTDNLGASFYVKGGAATVQSMDVYPMRSAWYDDSVPGDPVEMVLTASENTVEIGSRFSVEAELRPTFVADDTLTWSLSDPNVAEIVRTEKGGVELIARQAGTVGVTATAAGGLSRTLMIQVTDRYFMTNIDSWKTFGDWKRTQDGYRVNNTTGDMFLMGNVRAENFEMTADITNLSGNGSFGILFGAPDRENPSVSWYAANIDKLNRIARVFVIPKDTDVNRNVALSDELMAETTYHFRLRVENGVATYYLNDQLMMERALGDGYQGGYLGLVSYKTTAVFNNVYFTSLDEPTGPTEPEPTGTTPAETQPGPTGTTPSRSEPTGSESPSTGAALGGAPWALLAALLGAAGAVCACRRRKRA